MKTVSRTPPHPAPAAQAVRHWVRSIITPLVKISKSELRLFELDLMGGIAEQHGPDTLDWSSLNMQLPFDLRRTPDAAALAA